jgi:hypothetical protein
MRPGSSTVLLWLVCVLSAALSGSSPPWYLAVASALGRMSRICTLKKEEEEEEEEEKQTGFPCVLE